MNQQSEGAGQGSPDWKSEMTERLVYFPLGIASAVMSAAPTAAEAGKRLVENQVKTAEFLGKMTTEYLKRKYSGPEDLLKEAAHFVEGQAGSKFAMVSDLLGSLLPKQSTPKSTTQAPSPTDVTSQVVINDSVGGIDGYDHLTASGAIALFGELTDDQLSEVERYELEHRRRRTILGKISALREERSGH